MSDFLLPSLGADMDAATLVEWRVKPGDQFKRGDIVAAVETDKGIIDIELFEDGIVDQILVQPGARVAVGSVLATFHAVGDASSAPAEIPAAVPLAVAEEPPAPAAVTQLSKSSIADTAAEHEHEHEHERARISPAARRRARELNVDIENIAGSGPHGAITVEDVEQAGSVVVASTEKPAEKASTGMRRAIAAAMARSKREIPHYYLSTAIDLTQLLKWLEQLNASRPLTERIVYAVPLLKAVALALQSVPELNGTYVDNEFCASPTMHIGFAISLRQGGLVVPALRDVDKKDCATLMRELDDLVARARSGHLRSSELLDSTLTITSLGEQGIETVFPIIYPPQVAIVGFGSVVERAWSIDGMLASRHVITATLAADHRVSDGHRGARYLAALNRLLQEPDKL